MESFIRGIKYAWHTFVGLVTTVIIVALCDNSDSDELNGMKKIWGELYRWGILEKYEHN